MATLSAPSLSTLYRDINDLVIDIDLLHQEHVACPNHTAVKTLLDYKKAQKHAKEVEVNEISFPYPILRGKTPHPASPPPHLHLTCRPHSPLPFPSSPRLSFSPSLRRLAVADKHPHRKITQEEWDHQFDGQPAVTMPSIWAQGNGDSTWRALELIHAVLALAGSADFNDVVDEKEQQLKMLHDNRMALTNLDQQWDHLQEQQLELGGLEAGFTPEQDQTFADREWALLDEHQKVVAQPSPFISTVVLLPPQVFSSVASRNAAHSVGVLPCHHVIVSEYSIRFLQYIRAISRHEFDAAAALDSFRFLDKKSRSADAEDVNRLESSPLIRFCAEKGLGESSALLLAFARVMRDEQCKYSNIAFTFERAQHSYLNFRITYNRRSKGWTAQQLRSSKFAIPDDTLHFLEVPDFYESRDHPYAENFNCNANSVQEANPEHTNTKTIMATPIPREIKFITHPYFYHGLLHDQINVPHVEATKTPTNARPLMYDQPLSYPAHFATYIQSMLLRRYGSTMDQMGDIDSLPAVHQAVKSPSFPFYQQFFPKQPEQSSPNSTAATKPVKSIDNYLHNSDNWYKAQDSATDQILTSLRDIKVEELVAQKHAELVQQWDSLKEKHKTINALHDIDQSQPALAQLKAALKVSSPYKWNFDPHCSPFERLYYELKATLPLDEFLADLEADVTTLAKFAPTPLAMQFALSPVPYKDKHALDEVRNIHTADNVYDPAQGEWGTWWSALAPPLLD